MTDLILRQPVDLQLFAQSTRDIYSVAKVLAQTDFAPGAMRGDAEAVCAAIMYGAGLKMDPMTALRNIHVIDKQPTLSALAQRGLVLSEGHAIELIEASDVRVVMRGRRKGSERWQEVTWTIERAKKAGLIGKTNWQRHPQAMLVARASSELCRLIAADVLMGCPYSSEELGDGIIEDPEPPKAKATRDRVVRRDPIPATVAMPEPPFDEPVDNGPRAALGTDPASGRPDGDEDPVQDGTRKALMATFNEAGIKDRATRMDRVVEIVGRHVDSVNQLSDPEARFVIDAMRKVKALPSASDGWPAVAGQPS